MNRYLIKKYVFAALFTAGLFLFSGINLYENYEKITQEVAEEEKRLSLSLSQKIDLVEKTVNENITGRYAFIEGYGYLHNVLGKKEENNFEVVRDDDGYLYAAHFSDGPYYAVEELAARVLRMKESVSSGNGAAKVIALMPTVKEAKNNTTYFNETADRYIEALKKNDIPVIDFRSTEAVGKIPVKERSYKTDHHWKIETAFAAFTDLVKIMDAEYGTDWDADGFYTDLNHYNVLTYPQSFLGSYGRKTGILFGGLDDFTVIYPKFTTSYSYTYENQADGRKKGETLQGRFEEALFDSSYLTTDEIYNNDKYMCYLASLRAHDAITNLQRKDGSRVLFIRDSYSAPLAAFLSQVCGEVDMLYCLGYPDIENYVEQNKENYDYIYVSIYPENLTLEAFSFYEDTVKKVDSEKE